MSRLGGLAARGSILVAFVAVPSAAAIAYYLGAVEALSFLYGVGVGLAVFAAIALAVALILNGKSPQKMALGVGVYVGRLLFAGVALAVPVVLDLLLILPMVGGFVGVYVVENVALLQAARKLKGVSDAREN